ncbi:MAG: hypothetical protein OXG15_01110 [Gammaproteobacteria bacterium]|nr:hypothetical protein [Gammaproteobacteria bacterium]
MVLHLTTNFGLVDLDGSERETVLTMGEVGADKMTQVPGALLTDAEIICQLGAGHPFQAHVHLLDGRDPDVKRQEHPSGADISFDDGREFAAS